MELASPDPLTPSTRPKDQPRLPREWYERSSKFGYVQTLVPLGVLGGSLVVVGFGPRVFALPAAAVGAVAGYHLTFVLHDLAHGTLFETRAENERWGWIVGGIVGSNFELFKRMHWKHHNHFREPEDPQGADYNDLVPGRDRVILHLLKPLVLFNLVEKLSNFNTKMHSGMTRQELQNAGETPLSKADRRRGLKMIVGAHATMATLATGFGTRPLGYALFMSQLMTLGLCLSRVRSYLEHGVLEPGTEDSPIARTHVSNPIERNVLAGVLFNYHNEHHRWPQVPSRHLPRLHQEMTAGRLPDHDYSPSYAASFRTLMRNATQPLRRSLSARLFSRGQDVR